MPRSSGTDEALMAAYCGGDERSFRRLIERVGPGLHAFFMQSFQDQATAASLLNATVLELHRTRTSWRHYEAVRPFIFVRAGLVRAAEWQRRGGIPPAVDIDGGPASTDVPAFVAHALASLPETQRSIVHLQRREGFGVEDISRILMMPAAEVAELSAHAFEFLRGRLATVRTRGATAAVREVAS